MSKAKTPFLYLASLSGFSLSTFDLYQPALPTIVTYFHTKADLGQLTLSLYLFIFGLAQIIWGPLIDHFGRRRCLALALIIFMISTILCISSTNIYFLIAARALQAFAICCANIVAFSSTRDYEDVVERSKAISHISMVVSISPIFAPLIGSLIFLYLGWQSIFGFMFFLSLILFLLIKPVLKESPFWAQPQDSFTFIKSLNQYLIILKNKQLLLGSIILIAAFTNIIISLISSTYLIIKLLNYSPTQFSLIFAFNGFMMIIGNYLGIKLREYFSLKWNITLGSLLIIIGALTTYLLFYTQGLSVLSLSPVLLITLGVTFTNPPTLALALKDFSTTAASATAIINTLRMSLSAIIAGVISTLLISNLYIFPLSMLVTGIIVLLFSYFLKN